jgi:hypothetical protein
LIGGRGADLLQAQVLTLLHTLAKKKKKINWKYVDDLSIKAKATKPLRESHRDQSSLPWI